jgi:hypothetical protein
LTGAAAGGLILGSGGLAAATAKTPPLPSTGQAFRNSLSVTPFTDSMLEAGLVFTDGKIVADSLEEVQRLFVAHGGNEVYARIATRRQAVQAPDAEHGVKEGLEKARLARKLGLPFNPELGLWNVYGDISHQPGPDFSDYPQIRIPGPWETLTLAQMTTAMRDYGARVAQQILHTGADVNVWDLGNEVEFGVAGVAIRSFTTETPYWSYKAPDNVDVEIGKMDAYQLFGRPDRNEWLKAHLWPYVGAIFAAVAEGIRTVDPQARFSTHTSTVALQLPGLLEAFYQAMADAGFVVDEMGVSYYPTSATSANALLEFEATTAALRTRFGKKVFISETGYPSGRMGQPYEWNNPVPGYPLDTDGEYRFYRDLTAWGASTGVLSGIRPWAPDYALGGWQPMSHFTVNGSTAVAEPVLDSIRDGLKVSVPR